MTVKTLNSRLSPTAICRANGWTVGTRLVGDEGYGPAVIEITAVGESSVLAKKISQNGDTSKGYGETSWALWCRDWIEIETDH